MFRDVSSGRGRDNTCSGGDIEKFVRAGTTGSCSIDEIWYVDIDFESRVPHGHRSASDFSGTLPLGAQPNENCADLCRRRLATHDQVEDRFGLMLG